MSGEDGTPMASGQALDFDDDDQSGVPTAPMQAIPAGVGAPRRPAAKPSFPDMFDDDDDDDVRIGSTLHPITTTEHQVFDLDPETAARVAAMAKSKGPNLLFVVLRILILLGLLGGLGFAAYRAAQGQA